MTLQQKAIHDLRVAEAAIRIALASFEKLENKPTRVTDRDLRRAARAKILLRKSK